ncbi:unnamed protein product, partial [Medioppia subpectinata]
MTVCLYFFAKHINLENYNSLAQIFNKIRPSEICDYSGTIEINDGKYSFNIITSMVPEFQNLGILFVGKKEVPDILYRRKLEENQTLLNNSFINANAN